ncbi:MAG: class I SAM-dependent methyltransferase [Verrucomicrobia bacterium]|nr:class I SAM-dependent methyltransferase [Verrucomicrobiota bacterium]
MSDHTTQNVPQELAYQARQADALGAVQPTPEATLRRYRDHTGWRIHNKDFLFHCVKKYAPKRVCDFGCGAGETSTELAWIGYQVTGFDLSPELIELAKRRALLDKVVDRVQFLVADAAQLQLNAANFDLVLVQGVLHHIPIREGLDTLHALLAPGGVAVIQEPIIFSTALRRLRDLTPVPKDISPNERQLEPADIALVAEKFEIVERRYFNLLTRLQRLVPGCFPKVRGAFRTGLAWLDGALLTCVPPLRRFAGALVLVARKR